MAKIYSRPRIKLPKACINGDKINKKKLLNLLEIIIIFCIAGGVSKYINRGKNYFRQRPGGR